MEHMEQKMDNVIEASQHLKDELEEKIDNWFTYHRPTEDQIPKYGELRDAARTFVETVVRLTWTGPGCCYP